MISTVGVVVPAANEQEHVGACLDALGVARAHLLGISGDAVEARIVVVLDSCIDETASIVNRYGEIEVVTCNAGQAGAARAVGTAHLLGKATVPWSRIWLANTDADSLVPREWLARMVTEADRGADLVLGTVRPMAGLGFAAERAWSARHALREGHPHVHGANFGIRADAYAALGGWPRLASGEDATLARRAADSGHLRIVRTARIAVRTSSRLVGRAPRGFSSYLRGIVSEGIPDELLASDFARATSPSMTLTRAESPSIRPRPPRFVPADPDRVGAVVSSEAMEGIQATVQRRHR